MIVQPARIAARASSIPTRYGLWRRGDIGSSLRMIDAVSRLGQPLAAEPGAATERQAGGPMAAAAGAPSVRHPIAPSTIAPPSRAETRRASPRTRSTHSGLATGSSMVTGPACLPLTSCGPRHERREQEDPHDAAVLEEDRVGRRRPPGRDHEGRQARGAARARREEARPAAGELRPEEEEEDDGGGRGAVGGDLEGRLGDRLDADAAERPEEGGPGDLEDAPALRGHSTVTLFARLRGWSTSVPR